MPVDLQSRQALVELKRENQILDLWLAGNSLSEIAAETGMQTSDVQVLLATVQATYSMEMYELSSQLLLLNLGRAEKLIKAVFPQALTGDLRAIKAFTDLAKLEIEWHKQVIPPTHNEGEDDEGTVVVEKYEQTLTSRNNLYDIVLQHINEDWVSNTSIELDDIYKPTPEGQSTANGVWAGTPEPQDIRLAKIQEVVEKLQKGESDGNDGDSD